MTPERCAVCDSELMPELSACAACLLDVTLERPRRVADYELFQCLGQGSMGSVYLAKHVASDEIVALKLAQRELLQSEDGVALFRRQTRIESALRHPNILHVQGAGIHAGQPYLVMPLMEGGTLAEEANFSRYADAASQLQLMLEIARAVQFAHDRGVLHCDLKHDNILFDAEAKPHVSDFGLARSVDAFVSFGPSEVFGGTRGWMSPEQVKIWRSRDPNLMEPPAIASDVFALGLMLEWLRTAQLPYGDGDDFEERVVSEPPPPLSGWAPTLDWALAAVAHRALQKEPGQRYRSAAALADDLERARSHRPLRGCSVPAWGRAWYWSARHPGARVAILLLLPIFALLVLQVSRLQRDELKQSVLDMNAYAASGQAAAVLYQLREYADIIERAAEDPAVRALTRGPRRVQVPDSASEPCSVQTALEDPAPLEPYRSSYSTMIVLDDRGCARARVSEEPPTVEYVRQRFDVRDYFAGARADAMTRERTTYVRKAYRSSVSQLIRFAVSTSLFEGDEWAGVVSGSITAASTLELPRMQRSRSDPRLTVLLGPFEGERQLTLGSKLSVPAEDSAPEFTYLAHPRLDHGQKVTLDPALARELDQSFGKSTLRGTDAGSEARHPAPQFVLGTALPLRKADYVDPLLGDSWLAAFAPVGATGYVVLVQTPEDVATRPSNTLTRLGIGLALASGVLWVSWSSFWLWRWRRQAVPTKQRRRAE